MRRAAYTLVLRLMAPLVWAWMARRARKAGGDWGILSPERFGREAGTVNLDRPVWIHAVSLGETRAAEPLIQKVLDQGLPVLLTHTTATGRQEGARVFATAIAQGQLLQRWLPYDFPEATERFMRAWMPRCGVLIEREIWPNLLASAQRSQVPMTLVSARFSESSLRQARWLGRAMREAMGSLAAVLVQSTEDMRRLALAGARQLHITGNLKFDVTLPQRQLTEGRAVRSAIGRGVVVVASTREGEDEQFVAAIKALAPLPDMPLFVVVPRHPQRFDTLARQLEEAGLAYVRRSEGQGAPESSVAVLLGDTLGEMAFYYGMADVAVVAGSFARLGGQNLIEACAAAVPVIVGPHTFNFKQAAEDAIEAGAALRAADPIHALDDAMKLMADTPARQAMGKAALAFITAHAGATQRTFQALLPWL